MQQNPHCLLLAMVASQDNDTCLDLCQCAVFHTSACFLKCQCTHTVHVLERGSVHVTKLGVVIAGIVSIVTSRNLVGS